MACRGWKWPADVRGEPTREHTKAAPQQPHKRPPRAPDHADGTEPRGMCPTAAVGLVPADCRKPAPLLALRTHRRNREHRKICVFAWKAVFSPLASGMPARTQCLAGD